jgi:hypothetical protein
MVKQSKNIFDAMIIITTAISQVRNFDAIDKLFSIQEYLWVQKEIALNLGD